MSHRIGGRHAGSRSRPRKFLAEACGLTAADSDAFEAGAAVWGVIAEAAYTRNRSEHELLVDVTRESSKIVAEPSDDGIFLDPPVAQAGNTIMLGSVAYAHPGALR